MNAEAREHLLRAEYELNAAWRLTDPCDPVSALLSQAMTDLARVMQGAGERPEITGQGPVMGTPVQGSVEIRYVMVAQGSLGEFSLSVGSVLLNGRVPPMAAGAYAALKEQATPIARLVVQLTKK